jgi:hypothetical protein
MPPAAGTGTSTAVRDATVHLTRGQSGFATAALVLVAALATTAFGGVAAGTGRSWRVDFSGVRGVRPGMSVPEVARRWRVRFSFSTGSAPGCKIGGFSRDGVVGGALFQDGKFDAAWFSRGVTTREGIRIGSRVSDLRRVYGSRLRRVENLYDRKRPLYYVRGGKANLLLEFFPNRSGEIVSIGFGNGFVLAQEGCN